MARSEAQARALAKYRAEKMRSVTVAFYPKDTALWEHLQKQPNKARYIRELIAKDMATK